MDSHLFVWSTRKPSEKSCLRSQGPGPNLVWSELYFLVGKVYSEFNGSLSFSTPYTELEQQRLGKRPVSLTCELRKSPFLRTHIPKQVVHFFIGFGTEESSRSEPGPSPTQIPSLQERSLSILDHQSHYNHISTPSREGSQSLRKYFSPSVPTSVHSHVVGQSVRLWSRSGQLRRKRESTGRGINVAVYPAPNNSPGKEMSGLRMDRWRTKR